MKQYDAIIIGFGKGGKTLAAELARHNWQVAVIERSEKMYGGTCINIGCIPTKTLVHQAKTEAYKPEMSFEEKKEYYRKAIEKKEEVTTLLRDKNYHNLADNKNITVYTGIGSFLNADTVSVAMPEGTTELKAGKIFINTGAETVLPPIKGILNNPRVFNSTSIMELTELPRRLVIVGGGYIGLEFASIYASFGSQVTVLEGFSELIPREDRDIAEAVKNILESKGIRFELNVNVQSIENTGETAEITYWNAQSGQEQQIAAEAVLLATGRRPNTTGLNLEAAGVRTDERGAIIVDEYLKTTNPAIRAIGDVKGGLQFTYISLDDYRIIREDLFGDHSRKQSDRDPVSYSVFIDPPLSRIGMSETEARKQELDITVKKLAVAAIPRMLTINENKGLLKAVIHTPTGKILGCTLLCPESSEIINSVALAMKAGKDYTFLRDFIFTHPSMSEAFNELFH